MDPKLAPPMIFVNKPHRSFKDFQKMAPTKEKVKEGRRAGGIACTACGTTGYSDRPGAHGVSKLRRCSACENTWYCSRECQKKNWAHHKPFCDPTLQGGVQPAFGFCMGNPLITHYLRVAIAHQLGLHEHYSPPSQFEYTSGISDPGPGGSLEDAIDYDEWTEQFNPFKTKHVPFKDDAVKKEMRKMLFVHIDVGIEPTSVDEFMHIYETGTPSAFAKRGKTNKVEGMLQFTHILSLDTEDGKGSMLHPEEVHPFCERYRSMWEAQRAASDRAKDEAYPLVLARFVYLTQSTTCTFLIDRAAMEDAKAANPFFAFCERTSEVRRCEMAALSCFEYINNYIRADTTNQYLLRLPLRDVDLSIIHSARQDVTTLAKNQHSVWALQGKMRREGVHKRYISPERARALWAGVDYDPKKEARILEESEEEIVRRLPVLLDCLDGKTEEERREAVRARAEAEARDKSEGHKQPSASTSTSKGTKVPETKSKLKKTKSPSKDEEDEDGEPTVDPFLLGALLSLANQFSSSIYGSGSGSNPNQTETVHDSDSDETDSSPTANLRRAAKRKEKYIEYLKEMMKEDSGSSAERTRTRKSKDGSEESEVGVGVGSGSGMGSGVGDLDDSSSKGKKSSKKKKNKKKNGNGTGVQSVELRIEDVD